MAVDKWVQNGWLFEHDEERESYGRPAFVLPLMAVLQEHKESMPVQKYYSALNVHILCKPGTDSPV